MPTVLVASSGTGGHLFPAIALAQELVRRRPSTRIAFVGASRTAAQEAVAREGFEWYAVPGRGMPRRGLLGMIPFASALLRGLLTARRLVRKLRPDVAVGFGNFGSVAPLYAAYRRRVPVVIHEANAVPGKANRSLARYARAIAVQFEEAAAGFARRSVEHVGMPVRKELLEPTDRRAARRAYGLDEHAFTLLVMGGSQGARRLNEIVCAALPELERLEPRVQVIHLCGATHEAALRGAYEAHSIRHAVRAFETKMQLAYAAADCALCRAGAATLAELAVTGTPSILVPFPYATERHQVKNAEVFERSGAACLVEETDLTPSGLIDQIRRIIQRPVRAEMSRCARRLARPDAAERLADLVEKCAL